MYLIRKINKRINEVYSPLWDVAEKAEIKILNWKEFTYKPYTYAQILYSSYGIHIRIISDESPLLARETKQNSDVYKDSCVEFFLSPNKYDKRYLNFEFNPFGTMYISLRESRNKYTIVNETRALFNVNSAVEEERWILMFTIPFKFIDSIFEYHTNVMLGNLYKCGGQIKHYISYYPIHTEKPDFHRPDFFGEFVLENR